MLIRGITEFLRLEAASGILLLIAAILAMAAVNSPASTYYDVFLSIPVEIRFGDFEIAKPLLLWINDGLMAVFFFTIGLEVKREVLAGELRDPGRLGLPVIAAVGGMAVPAIIYSVLNWGDVVAMQGWAIPSATDIAFALGVLGLLGSRVPQSLKLFLMTLAIIDDLGAIIIIAIFYTTKLSVLSLGVACAGLVVLYIMNRRGVLTLTPYLLVGLVIWAAVLKSGVHATLAGVLVAFFIPYRKPPGKSLTILEGLEEDLHTAVAYLILPVFAFANTGIPLSGVTLQSVIHPVPVGIASGLFFGKQIGIFVFSWVAIKLRLASLPQSSGWLHLYGVSMLCGIGFTMSLFIGSLAFEDSGQYFAFDDRLGILMGSVAAGVCGYLVLRFAAGAVEPGPQPGR